MAKFGRKKSGTENKRADSTHRPAREASEHRKEETQAPAEQAQKNAPSSTGELSPDAPGETGATMSDNPDVGRDETESADASRAESGTYQDITGVDSGNDEGVDDAGATATKPASGDSTPQAADTNMAMGSSDPSEKEETEETRDNEIEHVRRKRARERILNDLRDGIDLKALARMETGAAREEIRTAVEEIARFRNLDLTPGELRQIARECADDMLGFGPLEKLLEQDDINDIMINGPETVYVERNGKTELSSVRFRDNQHLTTICQRIVGAIGRRVDESSPICDARLPDGSRVNVIIPPLAVDGACMTIRKFAQEKLTLDKLVEFGSVTPSCAKLIMAAGRSGVNVLVSGGTGSGKTTMLNCLTRYIENGERIITCEDACELQLQQSHVVRLETRPPNLEGVGEITMRDLVRNCLRMRPDRIIVGEVRGPEAFDLLQAMNTGHDGSMGTVHANNPRESISRLENMIAMGGLNLPTAAVREQITSALNMIIQVQRLRDGSRKVTNITEVTGMESDVISMQDLFRLDIQGEDENGKLKTELKSTGIRPQFFEKARQFGVENMVLDAMEEAYD